jgi:hypothetical protein
MGSYMTLDRISKNESANSSTKVLLEVGFLKISFIRKITLHYKDVYICLASLLTFLIVNFIKHFSSTY